MDFLRRLWKDRSESAPVDIRLRCDRCGIEKYPASSCRLVGEGISTDAALRELPGRHGFMGEFPFCVTSKCQCGRLASSFVKRSLADHLIANGTEVVPGISNALEEAMRKPFDQEKDNETT